MAVTRRAPNKRSKRKTKRRGPLVSRRWFDRAVGAGIALGALGLHTLVHDAEDEAPDPFDHPVAIAWLPEEIQAYRAHIHRASAAHGVEAELISLIILVESRGRADARSPVGARGLMQVMPRTARGACPGMLSTATVPVW